jgi:epoxyqueuosine reductase QueG
MIDAAAVKAMATALGAEACGIASAERFASAPAGFRPTDIYGACKSVVVFLKSMPGALLQTANPVPYSNTAHLIYAELDRLGLDLTRALRDRGVPAVPLPCDTPYLHWDEAEGRGMGILSMRHAAHLAGLGVLGRNTLLINPELGNLCYIGAVLTAAELQADPMLTGPHCPEDCRLCEEGCPEGAIVGRSVIQNRCRKSSITQVGRGFMIYQCNRCRRQCPRALGHWG